MMPSPGGASDAGSPIELSLIVPTHNRRASVVRLLERVREQVTRAGGVDATRIEVIVVADGCNDDTVDQLQRSIAQREWPFSLGVIEQSPGRGAGIARNAGAARAQGAILVFVDDDIEPFPTMLAAHLEAHAAIPAGESLVLVGAPLPVRPTPATLHDIAAWGWWEQQFEQMSAPGHRFTYDEVFTGILSMPASLFRAVGGFDESLGDCHEDSELGLRLFRAGARGGFSRAAGGVHHEMRDMHRLLPRKFAEGRADVRIAQRWPELAGYLRISWRRAPSHTLAGWVRLNAFRAPRVARVLTRIALPVLSILSRMRLRNQWRLLHGGILTQSYWLGVAAEVESEATLASRIAASGAGWARWSEGVRWLSIDLAAGIERAEQLIERNRPDALRVRLGDRDVGTIDPLPTAERLRGAHLRRLLATTLAHRLRTALALREALSGEAIAALAPSASEASELALAPASSAPSRISVIVPAYNAEATLRTALDSLVAQTFREWEAIVVDDGSLDATAGIAADYAKRDSRFRVVRQPNGGLSAARNAGIRVATSPWLHFLDADDWMAPAAFERMIAALDEDTTLDVVHCGWARVTEDGRVIAESRCWQVGDLFATFAVRCAIAVHACLVRRSLVVEAGAFDAGFRITQDWVLWQRIARRGARFGRVNDVLAFYAFRADSLSSDPMPLLREALRCIALGHATDPAVANAVHAAGRPSHELGAAQLQYVTWIAGMRIGRDEDAVPLLEFVSPTRTPPAPMWIAESLVRSVPHSLGVTHDEWPGRWQALLPRVEQFLVAVETHVGMAGYAKGVRVAMERAVAALATVRAMTLGLYHVEACECTAPIADVSVPPGCERLAVHVRARGESIGIVELPVIDGLVRGTVLRDAIAGTLAWPLLGRFFDETQYRHCTFHDDGNELSAWRDGECLATRLPMEPEARRQALHDVAGWNLFVRDLWDGANIDASDSSHEPSDDGAMTRGWIMREVSDRARAVPLVNGAADVLVTAGGVAVAMLRVEGEDEAIPAHELAQRLGDAIGFELCRVAVREALIGRSWDGVSSLRMALRRARSEARTEARTEARKEASTATATDATTAVPPDAPANSSADWSSDSTPARDFDTIAPADEESPGSHPSFAPGWRAHVRERAGTDRPLTILARRERRFIGGSGDRASAIGTAGRDLALQLARANGTPIVELTVDGRREPGGGAHDANSRTQHGALYLPSLRWREIGTPTRLRAVSPVVVGRDERIADDFDAESPPSAPPSPAADRLPILMYHRVAPTGPAARARWRVTPDAFDEQLHALAEQGYCTIQLEDWQRAMEQGRPLPPRPVLLTFDDGYEDFAEHAWPRLQRRGFGALAFIVTGCVGTHNSWDADATEESLMDWAQIRALRDAGVAFGAHSVLHRRFTTLSPSEAFEEAARSRLQLEEELQLAVDTFAYPYGAEDPVIRHIVGAAGFQFGLSVRSGSARRNAPWLALPRIEVTNEDSAETLLSRLAE